MSYCDRFASEVEAALGRIIRQLGLQLKSKEEVDGCRILYWTPRRDVRIYDSIREGGVNCEVFDKFDSSSDWTTIREAVGYGEGLTDAELEALMPEGFPSNEEMLREIGSMLLQLSW